MATLITVDGGTSNPDYIPVSELKDWFLDAKEGNDEVVISETSTGFELYGSADSDTLTAMGDVADALIKGGADADEITIKGATSNTSIFGGKAADTISFERAVVGGAVYGDTGKDVIDFTEKVSEGTVIDGGADDDTINFGGRITNVTVRGGAARDSIAVSESLDSLVDGGVDNDKLNFSGGHSNLIAKGGEGADTLVLDGTVSGTGNRFYGGKDNDSIEIQTGAAVAVHGDNENDIITLSAVESAASVFGGAGIDTLDLSAALKDSTLTAKGNAGNDDIVGSKAEADETIYGGQGDDSISSTGNGSRSYYGDKGDDVISIDSNEASMASGGEGDDQIDIDFAVDNAGVDEGDKTFHTVNGGAGVDTITVASSSDADFATTLQYASFAEFFTGGDVVDSISIDDTDIAKAAVDEALTFIDIDSFDRVVTGGGKRTGAAGAFSAEGLVIATTDKVTSGSSIVFSKDAEDYIAGVDLSASATTAGSVIDNSAGTDADLGMILKGTEGDNTIKGGAGADYIVGGSGADTLTGGAGADTIDAGTEGTDTVDGGAGDDYIDLGTDLSKADLVSGGADDDTLAFNHKSGSTDILDRVSEVEAIKLENTSADASIKLIDATVAAGETLTVTTSNNSFTAKLTFDASAEKDGKLNITGGAGADTITGGELNDTIAGGKGADSLTGGAGADTFKLSTTQELNGIDSITDFSGTDGDVIELMFGEAGGLPDQLALRGSGDKVRPNAAGSALGANTGLVRSSAAVADAAAAKTFMEGLTGEAADDIVYLIASTDPANAEGVVSLYSATYNDVDDATITTLATLGTLAIGDIAAANLANFS